MYRWRNTSIAQKQSSWDEPSANHVGSCKGYAKMRAMQPKASPSKHNEAFHEEQTLLIQQKQCYVHNCKMDNSEHNETHLHDKWSWSRSSGTIFTHTAIDIDCAHESWNNKHE